MIVVTEKVIKRPAEDVFRFVAAEHFENHPRWDADLVEMTPTSPGPMGLGTTGRVLRRQGRRRVEGTVEVTGYEPDRTAAFDVRFGSFRLVQRVECDPLDETTTRLRVTIETQASGPLRLLLPLMAPRFRKNLGASGEKIRVMLETGDRRD